MRRSVSGVRLDIAPEASDGSLTAALPAHAAGRWCRLRVFLPGHARWWARVTLTDPARGQVVRRVFLGPPRRGRQGVMLGIWRDTLVHVPRDAAFLTLHIFAAASDGALLRVAVLSRWEAAARLLWHGRRLLPGCLLGAPSGVAGRVRAVLGQAPARDGEAPPYDFWIASCESALPAPPDAPALDVQAVIFGDSADGLAATLASLRAQSKLALWPPCVVSANGGAETISADWIVILHAGEVLAPQAMAWFAHAAAVRPDAAGMIADFDHIAADGSRCDPVYLPGASRLVLRSRLPSAGAYVGRRHLAAFPPGTSARAVRRALLLQAPDEIVHVPRILTHVPVDAPAAVADAVSIARAADYAPSVAVLMPSQARSRHVVTCLRSLVENTWYMQMRVMMLLSAPDAANRHVLDSVRALPRVEVRHVVFDSFNYAAVNNAGAAALQDSEFFLLLNDDVAPIEADWLDAMLAHMQDSGVGIVGARLLYGNGMVQHEGVIMGLADLCEHAGRLRRGDDAGPHGIGMMSREVSAVTAACMLVRASVYRDLGGMDEGFAIALNDVDFCLRARQAGWRIVYCAEAVLYHYESLSLGRHYAGGRAALEGLEVRRLRDRWSEVIAADPYYSPLASLEPGREWQPAFPPRPSLPYMRRVTATHANPFAEDSRMPH